MSHSVCGCFLTPTQRLAVHTADLNPGEPRFNQEDSLLGRSIGALDGSN